MSDVMLLKTFDPFQCEIITEEIAPITEDRDGKTVTIPGRKKLMMKGILQKADTLNQNGRIYPKNILEREVKNYQKFINENRALGECVPPGTEIYTKTGWKKIEDISENEVIATLNVENNELQFQKIRAKIDIPYSGKMFRFKNKRSYDMCLTSNHRILAWDRYGKPQTLTAEELYQSFISKDSNVSHYRLRSGGAHWVGEDPSILEIAGQTVNAEDWAAYLGIYLSEGHSSGVYAADRLSEHAIIITQNEGKIAEEIRSLLEKLPWESSERKSGESRVDWTIIDESLHTHLVRFGGSREKRVPDYVKNWSPRLLNTLMTWMLMGDGRHRASARYGQLDEYCTSSSQLASDVYDIMLKLSWGANINTYEPVDKRSPDFEATGRMILAENQATMNIVARSYSSGPCLDFRFMEVTVEDYDGRVYCVRVPNGTWLMKYNGRVCWTHNCDHPDSSVIELKNASHIIREAHMEGNLVYGRIEILPTPSGEILQKLVESGVTLGISSRGVGSTKKEGDYYVVQDDFQLICWDFVSEPSTPGAFMMAESKKITDSQLKKLFNRSDRIYRVLNDINKK